MKIAILVSRFTPCKLGGTEIATYNIAKYLAQRGHEVHVITSTDNGLPQERVEDGFTVYRGRVTRKPVIGFASFLIHAFRIIKKIDPDLIHAQSIELALDAMLITKIFKMPYLTWGRGSDIYLPSKFYKRFYRLSLSNADAVIVQTGDEKRILQNTCNRNMVLMPNGIDMEMFANLSREKTRSRLQIKEGEKLILFVGSLRTVKGVKYLIRAMNVIRQKEPKIRLMLVGDGDERQDLEKLTNSLNLADYITFIGEVPNEEVPQYMAAADIFILPSLSEGFPVVIVEAMAAGIPVVVTDITGLSEIVRDGENGFLFESKNHMELAEKVLLLLQDDELRQRIAQNNRQRVKDYTWNNIIDKLEEVYQEIVFPFKVNLT